MILDPFLMLLFSQSAECSESTLRLTLNWMETMPSPGQTAIQRTFPVMVGHIHLCYSIQMPSQGSFLKAETLLLQHGQYLVTS